MKHTLEASYHDEKHPPEQHERPEMLRLSLAHLEREEACRIEPRLDALLKRSLCVVIGDGSARYCLPHASEFARRKDRDTVEGISRSSFPVRPGRRDMLPPSRATLPTSAPTCARDQQRPNTNRRDSHEASGHS